MGLDLSVEVGVKSSAASDAIACSGCGRARRLQERFSTRREKGEKPISVVEIGAATNRDDLCAKASEPVGHAALVGLLPEERSKMIGCSTSSASSFAAALFLRPPCGEAQHMTGREGGSFTEAWGARYELALVDVRSDSGIDDRLAAAPRKVPPSPVACGPRGDDYMEAHTDHLGRDGLVAGAQRLGLQNSSEGERAGLRHTEGRACPKPRRL